VDVTRRVSCPKCGFEREVDATAVEKDGVRVYYCPHCSGPRSYVDGQLRVDGIVALRDKFGLT